MVTGRAVEVRVFLVLVRVLLVVRWVPVDAVAPEGTQLLGVQDVPAGQ